MTTHYVALTIDTDPDGLNTSTPDRTNLVWDGLQFAMAYFHEAVPDYPLTWYVRADGQLEYAYGSSRYLLDEYSEFWSDALANGDELGWHPHLYTLPDDSSQPGIITDSIQAVTALQHTWSQIQDVPLDFNSFRMGEAWHTAETLNLIESLGFAIDSTAIPDRDDSASGHPRNWRGTPNRPYYPDKKLPRKQGGKRQLLEVPMNSWYFQASYDKAPKLRYMNPCIHSDLWRQAVKRWQETLSPAETYFWVMVLHPAEAMQHEKDDLLYAYSLDTMRDNLNIFQQTIESMGHDYKTITVSQVLDLI